MWNNKTILTDFLFLKMLIILLKYKKKIDQISNRALSNSFFFFNFILGNGNISKHQLEVFNPTKISYSWLNTYKVPQIFAWVHEGLFFFLHYWFGRSLINYIISSCKRKIPTSLYRKSVLILFEIYDPTKNLARSLGLAVITWKTIYTELNLNLGKVNILYTYIVALSDMHHLFNIFNII